MRCSVVPCKCMCKGAQLRWRFFVGCARNERLYRGDAHCAERAHLTDCLRNAGSRVFFDDALPFANIRFVPLQPAPVVDRSRASLPSIPALFSCWLAPLRWPSPLPRCPASSNRFARISNSCTVTLSPHPSERHPAAKASGRYQSECSNLVVPSRARHCVHLISSTRSSVCASRCYGALRSASLSVVENAAPNQP